MKNTNEDQSILKEYYSDLGFDQVLFGVGNIFKKTGNQRPKKTVIISDFVVARVICRWLGFTSDAPDYSIERARLYIAFKEAVMLLSKKRIRCLYFNRIGLKKTGDFYDDLAELRIKEKLSFPKMSENPEYYREHFEQILGFYSDEYIKEIKKIPQIIKKGEHYCHEDGLSKYVNVVGGYRLTVDRPENAKKRLHIYGRCGAFGYAVEDSQTIASCIQKMLNEDALSVEVINHGLWGGEDKLIYHNFLLDTLGFNENDIVLFYQRHPEKNLLKALTGCGIRYYDISDEWHEHEEARSCFYDKPGHMNANGYNITAKIIYSKIKDVLTDEKDYFEIEKEISVKNYNEYLRKAINTDFETEIKKYVSEIKASVSTDEKKTYGSIVMNCNPFTYGHRYLVEEALKMVDELIIFVVEENRSFFDFSDRFIMVKEGLKDLEHVSVVPSGKFIISSLTFPEYFLKDYVKEKDFDISSDLTVFCEHIAPALGISKRFAGQEPFDPVTGNYNENMKRLLPKYGIEFVEIPRKTTDDGKTIISATTVREMLEQDNLEMIRQFVPESTYNVLREKYAGVGR